MSAFAPLKLAGLTCAGVGGTCSVVYAGGSFISDISSVEADDDSVIKTIADDFSTRMISSSGNRSAAVWSKRLTQLRKDKGKTLDKDLTLIRDDNSKKEADLKTWCEEAKIKPSKTEESKLVSEGVEAYCTYVIEDQVSRAMSRSKTEASDWELVNKKFVEGKKESYSKELQAFFDEVKGHESTSEKLKDWCFKKYDEPFKGKDDPVFKEVSKVCATVNPPKPPAKPAAAKPEANKQTDPVNTQPQDQATVPQSPSQPAVSSSPVASPQPSGAKQAGDI
ncbi:hypothetical protein MHF_0841 [Mycoplasma haemofelis Ohio2]|uniref:Uncharacterized protein n=1 Tax=Mycoplasma haemofelis (strain Ohio2) TaxID=859194 RepID=F6FIQ7_MYCHI|nr:hypothetical protein MHF_0841 [Mycoplasma haemofelis Ohio2]